MPSSKWWWGFGVGVLTGVFVVPMLRSKFPKIPG